jgi:hypothetical protein
LNDHELSEVATLYSLSVAWYHSSIVLDWLGRTYDG